jgi:MOSC domain-containing protein YiiM
MRVLSVNIGQPRQIPGGSHRTGIYKNPVGGAVNITALGIQGDSICNAKHHGGADQAVYLYGEPDYLWWADVLGRELPPGTFGENLTITELESARMHIGDRFHIGAVILEASAPRIPCSNLATRMDDPPFAKRFRDAERPGMYCRVIQKGSVQTGDAVALEPAADSAVHSLELFREFYSTLVDEAAIRRLLAAPIALRARIELEKRIQK